MSWSTMRKATDADLEAVRNAAERFCQRHGIEVHDDETPEFAIDFALSLTAANCGYSYEDRARRLRSLWRRILKRITGSPDGIAYGYVGSHVD